MYGLLDATGMVAAFLTTMAFLPQVRQTWRSGSTADLNLGMLLTLSLGVALWLIYGLGTGQLPVILANGATLLLVAVLLGLKLRDVLTRAGTGAGVFPK
ncbi:SemiSWEET family sugar transporter [uncultured Amaricoccus sp.]|uniref:SemiSWEET family sugar transporter n=1 Tax=uncultured Amaricoccus sp. TaxID=339341 RepID=UPI0026019463|nr:SemiSWEET transporter [uncultured Amaricoccus sp.]